MCQQYELTNTTKAMGPPELGRFLQNYLNDLGLSLPIHIYLPRYTVSKNNK